MNDNNKALQRESIVLRIVWMVVFAVVWQVAEIVLALVVLAQLAYRLFNSVTHSGLLRFGDSLSQYLAQIGRFGTFNSEEKPWPFADWPSSRAPQGEAAHSVSPAPPAVRDDEHKL